MIAESYLHQLCHTVRHRQCHLIRYDMMIPSRRHSTIYSSIYGQTESCECHSIQHVAPHSSRRQLIILLYLSFWIKPQIVWFCAIFYNFPTDCVLIYDKMMRNILFLKPIQWSCLFLGKWREEEESGRCAFGKSYTHNGCALASASRFVH